MDQKRRSNGLEIPGFETTPGLDETEWAEKPHVSPGETWGTRAAG